MSSENVEPALVSHIAAAIPTLTAGQNIRRGPRMKPSDRQDIAGAIPQQCVFVLLTSGLAPITYLGSQSSTLNPNLLAGEDYPTVQIWIRSNPLDYDGGRNLSFSVLRAVDRKPPSGFYESEVRGSGPNYIGQDDQNCHEWSINITLKASR